MKRNLVGKILGKIKIFVQDFVPIRTALTPAFMVKNSCTKILILPKILPTRFCFTFYGNKILCKNLSRFSDGRKCALSWQNLSPRFSNDGCHENLDVARQIKCAASFLAWGISRKHLKHKNAHGDCDAAIAKATAVVTHVQSLNQEVGSGDEGPGLFGFDLSSAETGFWWLGEEQNEESKPIQHGIDLGSWLQKKLGNLSAAPDELDHACREARDFASRFRISYYIFMSIVEAAKPAFSVCIRLCLLGS